MCFSRGKASLAINTRMPCSRNEYRRPRIVGPWRGEKVPMADGYSCFHVRLFGMRDRHCRRAGDVVLSLSLPRLIRRSRQRTRWRWRPSPICFGQRSRHALIPSPTSPAPTRTLRPELHLKKRPQVASQNASNVSTADASPAAPAAKKTQLAHAQLLRRLAQEDRARRWAYQQDPSFETRFLGYAD